MGWTSQHKPEGVTPKQFFTKQWTEDNERNSFKVLKIACKPNVAFLQIERINKQTGKRSVFAVVVEYTNHPSEHYNFTWKDIDESMGPYQTECPLDILDGLDPPEGEYAAQWRERVLAYHAAKKSLPKDGQWVKFNHPLKFNNGMRCDLFKCQKVGRLKYFVAEPGGWHCKITRRALQGEGVTVHNEKPQVAELVG